MLKCASSYSLRFDAEAIKSARSNEVNKKQCTGKKCRKKCDLSYLFSTSTLSAFTFYSEIIIMSDKKFNYQNANPRTVLAMNELAQVHIQER